MMLQFERIGRYLTVLDLERYDPIWGFQRVIKELK